MLGWIVKLGMTLLGWLGIVTGVTILLWYVYPGTGSEKRIDGDHRLRNIVKEKAPRQSLFIQISVFLVPLATGWVGFAGTFSDRGPGETILQRSIEIVGIQMLGAIVFSVLSPKRWYVCVLAAWGSLFWFAYAPSLAYDTTPIQYPEDMIHPGWVPLAAVLLTIAAGYIASRVRIAEGVVSPRRRRSWFVKAMLALTIVIVGYVWLLSRETVRVQAVAENTLRAQALWRELDPLLPAGTSEEDVLTFLRRNHPQYVRSQATARMEYRVPVGEEPASKSWYGGSWTAGVRLVIEDGRLVRTEVGRWSSD